MRVRVWRNLRDECWTVYRCSERRCFPFQQFVFLSDVTFHVSKRGRKRSIKGRWDSRHAYAEGEMIGISQMRSDSKVAGVLRELEAKALVYSPNVGKFIDSAGIGVQYATVACFNTGITVMGVGS